MKQGQLEPDKLWQKTSVTNLVRYKPSAKLFARVRVGGKLILKSLKTDKISVAQLRLADLVKQERQAFENQQAVAEGKLTFGAALKIYRERVKGDASLKQRTKDHREERISTILRTWPNIEKLDARKITKHDCLRWAANYKSSPVNFNKTFQTLRAVMEIVIEAGVRYENPARFIKSMKMRPKVLRLPTRGEFHALVERVRFINKRFSNDAADLVEFLAYGGFRKSEAKNIHWSDCNFERKEILVRGDEETGTKNWSVRTVPMIAEMQHLLERLKAARENEPDSSPIMRVSECNGSMASACSHLQIAKITHHDLRHLFATTCIESGVDIPTVSRWLGHKDGGALAMKVYGHLRDQHSTSMAQKVSFAVAAPQEKDARPLNSEGAAPASI